MEKKEKIIPLEENSYEISFDSKLSFPSTSNVNLKSNIPFGSSTVLNSAYWRENRILASYLGKFCGEHYKNWRIARKKLISKVPEYLYYFPIRIRKNFFKTKQRLGDIHPLCGEFHWKKTTSRLKIKK